MRRSLVSSAVIILSSLAVAAEARAGFTYTGETVQAVRYGGVVNATGGQNTYESYTPGASSVTNGQAGSNSANSVQANKTSTSVSVTLGASASGFSSSTTGANAGTIANYAVDFTVDVTGLYTLAGTATLNVTSTGSFVYSYYEYRAYVYDYDAGSLVQDYSKANFSGSVTEVGQLPTQVSLVAGTHYQFYAENNAQYNLYQSNSTINGAVSSTFTLTAPAVAVPEPSSLVLCGLAGVVGLGVARARRRATPAA